MTGTSSLGAILLAGGRASRVDGQAKPLFEVDGRTLLAAAVDAVRTAGASRVTVVGPVLDATLPVRWVREEPAFGGPVAAIVAALHAADVDDDPAWTLVIACDLPTVADAVAALTRDLALYPTDTDAVCLADPSSRPQWLIGAYRTSALRRAASELPSAGRDASVRSLVSDLAIAVLTVDARLTQDIDTWDDLRAARARSTEETP